MSGRAVGEPSEPGPRRGRNPGSLAPVRRSRGETVRWPRRFDCSRRRRRSLSAHAVGGCVGAKLSILWVLRPVLSCPVAAWPLPPAHSSFLAGARGERTRAIRRARRPRDLQLRGHVRPPSSPGAIGQRTLSPEHSKRLRPSIFSSRVAVKRGPPPLTGTSVSTTNHRQRYGDRSAVEHTMAIAYRPTIGMRRHSGPSRVTYHGAKRPGSA